MAKKPKQGSGDRFKQLSDQLGQRGVDDPNALAAFVGRKKFGKDKMSKMAEKGKKDSSSSSSSSSDS